MRLLVVEDERRMAELLRKGLAEEGHAVTVAADGVDGLSCARSGAFDAIILDVMLPRMDGFEMARRLRGDGNRTPILMLTARDAATEIVKGLDLGADDYLTKPFSFEVLLARIRALLRRGAAASPPQLQVGRLLLDPASREVMCAGMKVDLTRTEFSLLEFLLRHAGRVVPRDTLIEAVWGPECDIESNTLDAFIRSLRVKIEAGGPTRYIHTVRGVGYTLREERSA
jgi:DNA-binding response OmpR family regulator